MTAKLTIQQRVLSSYRYVENNNVS